MASSTNLISGLSSGFDWQSMVTSLIKIDHQRIDLVETKKIQDEDKLAEWKSFNTSLLAVKTSAENLNDPDFFQVFKSALSTDNSDVKGADILSVTTGDAAAPGSYTVKVTNLATAQKLSSNPFTSSTEELGSAYEGDIVINGKVLNIEATQSLGDIAASINNLNSGSDPSRVTATIVTYGSNDYRLILTSDDTGGDGISLLNGSAADLVQRFGWKDGESGAVKNSITGGAQSDLFSMPATSIQSLLGLASGVVATVGIGNKTVEVNLGTMSLNDIKAAITTAAPTGVTASVVSEQHDGKTYYRLQIDGTQTFSDASNILNTLGILDHTSTDVSGKISGKAMTENGATITAATLLKNIDGYNTFTSGGFPDGDYIACTGTDTAGAAVISNFSIASTTTVQDLLDEIETRYGDVLAYVTADGKIRVDKLSGAGALAVNLTDHLANGSSSLEFVEGDGSFSAADLRKREIVAGQDASVVIDGVTVTRESNTIDDIIGGVTLNLANEDAATTVTVNISRDVSSIKAKIQDFVTKYNAAMSYINTQFTYDTENKSKGGILFGDGTLGSVKSQLSSLLIEGVWGVNSQFSTLGLIGVNLDDDILLKVDSSKLEGYLKTNFNDVMSLFTARGVTSKSNLAYSSHTKDTKAGDYNVQINRAATRGAETGNVDLSSGGAADTLTITQNDATATISITADMSIDDIVNAINTEFDAEYNHIIVGDQALKEDDNSTPVSSLTKWDNIFGATLQDGDVFNFTGTSRSGATVSGSYTIDDKSTDTMSGLLAAIESAYGSEVIATLDTAGRLSIADRYNRNSDLAIEITEPDGRGIDFGTIDVTAAGGDGSQVGRYAMTLAAAKDDSGQLIIRNDDYGSASFTIDLDTTDNNYDQVLCSATSNGTVSSSGAAFVTSATKWNEVYGADAANGDTVVISGKARNGITGISGTYTITDKATDTIDGLLTAIEAAYTAQGTTVEAFLRDGRIYVEDKTSGASAITLTLTANNEGGGELSFGVIDQVTKRDLDLGMITGTYAGQDVAGSINGETASGSGQVLRGADDNTNTAGLSVVYSGTTDNSDAGNIKLTLGVGELFSRSLFGITDPLEGYVSFKQTSLQASIDSKDTQIDQMEAFLERKSEMMITRFVAMEKALNMIQSQGDWLNSQLNALYSYK